MATENITNNLPAKNMKRRFDFFAVVILFSLI